MNRFIAIVGMAGAGKSVIADALIQRGFHFFRFGQITMDILTEKGLEVNEANERHIRESVRKEHGMGAYAILNLQKINSLLEKGSVVGDGLYSWSEYKILKEKYGKQMVVIAVYAPPETRYFRLEKRSLEKVDTQLRNRPITRESAMKRDFSEIENIEKGGPIAMADFTLVNTGSRDELIHQFEKAMHEIKKIV